MFCPCRRLTLGGASTSCVSEDAAETLARRIAAAHDRAIPIFVIAGAREAAAQNVSLRERDGRQATLGLQEALQCLKALAA